jgi:hypothetical protein
MKETTLLSFGGGQDSTAILLAIIYNPEFKAKYVKGNLVVIMSNTKDEHDETYEHVELIADLCKKNNIEFLLLDPKGYTSDCWGDGLIEFYKQKKAVGSKAFPKTCTDKLKITPIYNYLEKKLDPSSTRKKAFYDYYIQHGKLNVLIGIAKGEEKRVQSGDGPSVWMNKTIQKKYPLIDLGMDRQACQDFIKMYMKVPIPSNCVLCPFMSLQELLYLYRVLPHRYYEWVEIEAAKIENNKDKVSPDKNLGVWGKKLLPEVLKEAEEKFGHMTIQDLREYKMSHGHCVASKY